MKITKSIQSRIYELRGERVMLDYDLASLYEVETRILNQAVKRNIERFPADFMFRLKPLEYQSIKYQIEKLNASSSSQIVMMGKLSKNRTEKYLPYAFTEQGVAMLSGILNSEKAIKMNIDIMRAFVEIRRIALSHIDIKRQLKEIRKRLENHDMNIVQLYEAMENLLDEKAAQKKWEERERIGFKKNSNE